MLIINSFLTLLNIYLSLDIVESTFVFKSVLINKKGKSNLLSFFKAILYFLFLSINNFSSVSWDVEIKQEN